MQTRYYVSFQGREGALLTEGAANRLKLNATANLREVRIESGFDYHGFNIVGVSVPTGGPASLDAVQDWLRASDGGDPAQTRIVISEGPLTDSGEVAGFRLLVGISEGNRYEWCAGSGGACADIRIDSAQRSAKVSASVQDVFQDVMLANDSSVQAVVAKHRAAMIRAGSSEAAAALELYRLKALFAKTRSDGGSPPKLLERYAPDGYASFATLARRDLLAGMSPAERRSFVQLWTDFLVTEFAEHFLTAEEAADLVRSSYFHAAAPGLNVAGGRGARTQHEWIKAGRLREILSDRQVVRRTGTYVLCLATGRGEDSAQRLGPVFGWVNQPKGNPERLKLCTPKEYGQMVPLVRDGIVTPFRLFLKV